MSKVKVNTATFSGFVLHDFSINDKFPNIGGTSVSIDRSYKKKDGSGWENKSVIVKIKSFGDKQFDYFKSKIVKGAEILFINAELDSCEAWVSRDGNNMGSPVYLVNKIQVLKEGGEVVHSNEDTEDFPF